MSKLALQAADQRISEAVKIQVNDRRVNDWPTDSHSQMLSVTISSSNGVWIDSTIEVVSKTKAVRLHRDSDKPYNMLAKRFYSYGEDRQPLYDLVLKKIESCSDLFDKDQVTFRV